MTDADGLFIAFPMNGYGRYHPGTRGEQGSTDLPGSGAFCIDFFMLPTAPGRTDPCLCMDSNACPGGLFSNSPPCQPCARGPPWQGSGVGLAPDIEHIGQLGNAIENASQGAQIGHFQHQ